MIWDSQNIMRIAEPSNSWIISQQLPQRDVHLRANNLQILEGKVGMVFLECFHSATLLYKLLLSRHGVDGFV